MCGASDAGKSGGVPQLYVDSLPPPSLPPRSSFPPVDALALAFFDPGYRIFDPFLAEQSIFHPVGLSTIPSLNLAIIVQ